MGEGRIWWRRLASSRLDKMCEVFGGPLIGWTLSPWAEARSGAGRVEWGVRAELGVRAAEDREADERVGSEKTQNEAWISGGKAFEILSEAKGPVKRWRKTAGKEESPGQAGSKDTKEGASEEVPRTTEAEQQETGHSVSAMEVWGDLGLSGHPLENGVWVPASEWSSWETTMHCLSFSLLKLLTLELLKGQSMTHTQFHFD